MEKKIKIAIIAGSVGFAIAAAVVLITVGYAGLYILGGMLLFFGGMFLLFYKLFFKQMMLESRLRKIGIDSKAVIKEMHPTGVRINYDPQYKLTLEVKNSFGLIYTATLRTVIPRKQPDIYKTGMTIPVKIDPENENNVIINADALSQPSHFPA